ncbi:methyltransferase family protein [Pseudochrobactrum sp. MP213Fo]|uniref:methyltransferase family protein n=1 Tax=Pseudochrobactrum sp. MP213Fo TaxID=3022250 RepID=UPI003B9EB311
MQSMKEMSRYQARRRIAVALIIALLFCALLFVRSAWQRGIHEYIEAFGLGFIMMAILGRMWCTLHIGGHKGANIIRTGPYSVSRNPLYVFSTIGAFGIGCMTGSLIIALLLAVVCYITFMFVIMAEEGYLENTFGQAYRDYKLDVPRFFPNFSGYKDVETLTIRPKTLYNTFFDGLVFFIAYPVFEFVEYLQNIGVIPVLLHVY